MKKEITLPKFKKTERTIGQIREDSKNRNRANNSSFNERKYANMSLWREDEDGTVYYNSDTFLNPIVGLYIKENTINTRKPCTTPIRMPSRTR